MELYLKITAGLLLLVQAAHLASIQHTTDSPGRTIPISWLRELAKNTAGSQNAAVPAEETEYDQRADGAALESSGIASGSMVVYNEEEEENVKGRDKDANEGSDDLAVVTTTMPPTVQNATIKHPDLPDTNVSLLNATTDPTNSSQINMTDAEEEFNNSATTPHNSTTHPSAQNSTSFPDHSNHTDLQTTTLAPEGNTTQESATKPDEDTWLPNATESTNTTTVMSTTTPEINETTATSSSTTVFLSDTTETSPETMTAAAPITPEKANKTEKGSGSAPAGSSSERGLDSGHHRSRRNGAWGAVLGTAVAVAFVGLVAYVILKKKHRKGFSHRKLVEEFPSDPVLRLDNNEPLDLNFGGSAYYNPGLQGDNIQMSNLPGRH